MVLMILEMCAGPTQSQHICYAFLASPGPVRRWLWRISSVERRVWLWSDSRGSPWESGHHISLWLWNQGVESVCCHWIRVSGRSVFTKSGHQVGLFPLNQGIRSSCFHWIRIPDQSVSTEQVHQVGLFSPNQGTRSVCFVWICHQIGLFLLNRGLQVGLFPLNQRDWRPFKRRVEAAQVGCLSWRLALEPAESVSYWSDCCRLLCLLPLLRLWRSWHILALDEDFYNWSYE